MWIVTGLHNINAVTDGNRLIKGHQSALYRFAAQTVKTEVDVSVLILAHAQLVGPAAHVMLMLMSVNMIITVAVNFAKMLTVPIAVVATRASH